MGLLDSLVQASPLGWVSAGLSAADSVLNFFNKKSANDANMKIAQLNNQTQMDIANKNNAMQMMMNRENNDFNRRMALEMFNLENNYNSPIEQMKRLQAAGINPNLYFANSNGSAGVANASTPSAATSGMSPSMPTFTTPHIEPLPSLVGGSLQALNLLAQTASYSAAAGKAGAETNQITAMLDDQLRNLRLENENIEVKTNAQRFQNEMEYLWQNAERGSRQRKLIEEITKLGADVMLAASQGRLNDANALLADVERRFTDSRNTELKLRLPYVQSTLKAQIKLYEEQTRTEQSQQASNYAAAENQRSQAAKTREETSQLQDMHSALVEATRADSQIKVMEAGKMAETYHEQILEIVNRSDISEGEKYKMLAEADRAMQLADLAKKENKTYYARQALDMLKSVVTGLGALYGLKFLGQRGSNPPPSGPPRFDQYQNRTIY